MPQALDPGARLFARVGRSDKHVAEIGPRPLAMLEYPFGQLGGNAYVHCAAIAIGHDVNLAATSFPNHGLI